MQGRKFRVIHTILQHVVRVAMKQIIYCMISADKQFVNRLQIVNVTVTYTDPLYTAAVGA